MTRARCMTVCLALALVIVQAPATAQTGPLEPRLVIAGQPYPQFDSSLAVEFLGATAQLTVDEEGHVTAVRIVETSGNEQFDRIVRDYYAKFRLIPAISEAGVPMAGTSEVRFRVAIDDPVAERLRGADDFLQAEIKRIRRMHCDDFLWEYERMQEIAHGAALDQEYLFQTSFAMVESIQKLTPVEVEKVRKKANGVLKDTARQCRANPEARYFADAYQPTVLKRAGR